MLNYPPLNNLAQPHKKRESNLELYRIIVMLLIIAHHYVVNSGLIQVIYDNPLSPSSLVMLLFGAWGKTGINCFVLITGYFMCKQEYSLKKILKLYLQILFYTIIIYSIFLVSGHETLSLTRLAKVVIPIFNLSPSNFIGCFLVFYLFIPFANILINNLTSRQHCLLAALLIIAYSILPTLKSAMPVNYIGWFFVLYILASYIRLYGLPFVLSAKSWGIISIASIFVSGISIIGMFHLYSKGIIHSRDAYYFVSDSNKILALLTGLSSFMFFKSIKIPYSRFINFLGTATFGVFLIHTNSDSMRKWLWRETVDCVGHFDDNVLWTLSYAAVSVVIIFIVCTAIEWFRYTYIDNRLYLAAEQSLKKIKVTRVIKKFSFR